MDNLGIYGCAGCSTTGGRMSCAIHGQITYVIVSHKTDIIWGLPTPPPNNWKKGATT